MIYFVDEDVTQLKPYASELALRGHTVTQIDNADDAYAVLSHATDIDLAVIDIMLATQDVDRSRFTREASKDFLVTGLLLINDLIQANPRFFPKTLLIFSMATTAPLVQEIHGLSDARAIPYLRKRDFPSPFHFGEKIESHLRSLRLG